MSYVSRRTEVASIEKMIAQEKAKQAELCDYLVECDSHVLGYDSSVCENDRIDDMRYYSDESERVQLELKLIANTIEYLEKQLALIK